MRSAVSRIIRVGPCACRLYRSGVTDDRQPGDLVFRVLDYEGVDVVCTVWRWGEKVDNQHSELSDRREIVMEAVQRPRLVLRDRDYPNRKHLMVPASAGRWLKVVVDYAPDPITGEQKGTVVTVFYHRRMRRGDTLLYTRGGG